MPSHARWVRGKEDFASFPVLAALAQRPLTTMELAHILLTSQSKVRERLITLEERGWVVQRVKDKRWVMIIRLMATGVPTPHGESWVNPDVETLLEPGPPTDRIVLEASGDAGLEPCEPRVKRLVARPVARPPEPPKANPEKVAAHFGVPVDIGGVGVGVGVVGPCHWCGTKTPLRYGDRSLCPPCAKVEESRTKEETP